MDIRDVVLRSVPTVKVEASLREVAEIMAQQGGSAVLVVDEAGKVLGVVTEAVLASALSRVFEASQPAAPTRRSGVHRAPSLPVVGRNTRANMRAAEAR